MIKPMIFTDGGVVRFDGRVVDGRVVLTAGTSEDHTMRKLASMATKTIQIYLNPILTLGTIIHLNQNPIFGANRMGSIIDSD